MVGLSLVGGVVNGDVSDADTLSGDVIGEGAGYDSQCVCW